MLIWLLAGIFLMVVFFCTLGSAALNAIPLERLWRLKQGKGRTAAGVEYWSTHSQQITWSFRVVSRISCVALALVLLTIIEGEPLPYYGFIIALAVAAILIAFPGSLIPAAWAQLAGEKIGLNLLPFVRLIGIVFTPISVLCHGVLNVVLKPFGVAPLSFTPLRLRSELEQCVGGLERSAKLSDHEKRMIRHIFSLGDREAREIMTPRMDMICVSENDSVEAAIDLINRERVSRIPVFRGNVESVVGVIYAKEILDALRSPGAMNRRVGELMHEPLFMPETARLRVLFSEMLKRHLHMAIIVDEYGSAVGIATMEDILEEIVGEIRDEHDLGEDKFLEKAGDGVYRVDARLPVRDAREDLGLKIPEKDDYDTLGGFVCAYFGKVPAVGEAIEWEGQSIRVLEATPTGVSRLEIRTQRT